MGEFLVSDPATGKQFKLIGDSAPTEAELTAIFGPEPGSTGLERYLKDPAIALAQGVIGVPEAVTGILDIPTLGAAGKIAEAAGVKFKEAKDILGSYQTPEMQEAQQKVRETKGFVPTIKSAIQNPAAIAQTVIESAPSMFAGGAIAKTLKYAPLVAGAIGEGAIAAGAGAEQVRQQSESGLLTPAQSVIQLVSGALTGALGVLGGKLAKRLGIADIDTLMAGEASDKLKRNVILQAIAGAVQEGVFEELPQSIQEQIAQNLSLGKPWSEGVLESGAMGALTGGVIGTLANAIQPTPLSKEQKEAIKKANEDLVKGPSEEVKKLQGKTQQEVAEEAFREAVAQMPAQPPTTITIDGQQVPIEQVPEQQKGVPDASAIRANQGQLPQERQEPQGVQAPRSDDLQQAAPVQPEPVAQRAEAQPGAPVASPELQSLRQQYLDEQKRIAAPFIERGGESAKLAAERVAEAERVVALPDAEFSDYIQDWKPEPVTSPAPSPPAAPAAKEAWEMTQTELAERELARYKSALESGNPNSIVIDPDFKKNLPKRRAELKAMTPEQQLDAMRKNWASYHRNSVEVALESGKPVPAEVLAEYPDLKVKVAPVATPTPATPVAEAKPAAQPALTAVRKGKTFQWQVLQDGKPVGEPLKAKTEQHALQLHREREAEQAKQPPRVQIIGDDFHPMTVRRGPPPETLVGAGATHEAREEQHLRDLEQAGETFLFGQVSALNRHFYEKYGVTPFKDIVIVTDDNRQRLPIKTIGGFGLYSDPASSEGVLYLNSLELKDSAELMGEKFRDGLRAVWSEEGIHKYSVRVLWNEWNDKVRKGDKSVEPGAEGFRTYSAEAYKKIYDEMTPEQVKDTQFYYMGEERYGQGFRIEDPAIIAAEYVRMRIQLAKEGLLTEKYTKLFSKEAAAKIGKNTESFLRKIIKFFGLGKYLDKTGIESHLDAIHKLLGEPRADYQKLTQKQLLKLDATDLIAAAHDHNVRTTAIAKYRTNPNARTKGELVAKIVEARTSKQEPMTNNSGDLLPGVDITELYLGKPEGAGSWKKGAPFITNFENDPKVYSEGLAEELGKGTFVQGRGRNVAARLVAFRTPDGKVELRGLRRGESGMEVQTGLPRQYVSLKDFMAEGNEPIASILLREPVSQFRQTYPSEAEFKQEWNFGYEQQEKPLIEAPSTGRGVEAAEVPEDLDAYSKIAKEGMGEGLLKSFQDGYAQPVEGSAVLGALAQARRTHPKELEKLLKSIRSEFANYEDIISIIDRAVRPEGGTDSGGGEGGAGVQRQQPRPGGQPGDGRQVRRTAGEGDAGTEGEAQQGAGLAAAKPDDLSSTPLDKELASAAESVDIGNWIESKMYGVANKFRPAPVLSPATRLESAKDAEDLFRQAGVPVVQGGQIFKNSSGPDGYWRLANPRTPNEKGGEKLLELFNKKLDEVQGDREAAISSAFSANANTSIRHIVTNMNRDEAAGLPVAWSKDLRARLMASAQGAVRIVAQQLAAHRGAPESLIDIAQNFDTNLRINRFNQLGGEQIEPVMKQIWETFKGQFTPEQLENILKDNPTLAGFGEEMAKQAVDDSSGSRFYKRVQSLYNPKKPKTLKSMLSLAREDEKLADIVTQLEKLYGVVPPKKNQKKLTPLEKLLHFVKPETVDKIEALTAAAVKEAEQRVGEEAILNRAATKEERAELKRQLEEGELLVDPDDIEEGLDLPRHAHWKLIRESVLGYSPTTLKAVQDLISSDFSGAKFKEATAKAPDTKISLTQLAANPEAEVNRVLNEYLNGVEAAIGDTALPETKLRVIQMAREQIGKQIEGIRKQMRDAVLEEKAGKEPTNRDDFAAIRKLANAGIFADDRLSTLEIVKRLTGNAAVQKLLPPMSSLVQAALELPVARQSDFADRFAAEIARRLSLNPEQQERARKVFHEAFDAKFTEARKQALTQAKESLAPTPKDERLGRSLWQKIERFVNAGGFETDGVLIELAKEKGWKIPTEEQIQQMRDWAAREEELRLLPADKADALADKPEELAKAQADWESATRDERSILKKEMQTMWSRMSLPLNASQHWRNWDTTYNNARAVLEYSQANTLLRLSFAPRQLMDVISFGMLNTLTRPYAHAVERVKKAAERGEKISTTREYFDALKEAIDIRWQGRGAAWRAAAEALKGRGLMKQYDIAQARIGLFDRLNQQADAEYARGNYAGWFMRKVVGIPQAAFRVVGALDVLQSAPIEFQELRHRITTQFIEQVVENGGTRAQGKVAADVFFENVRGEMNAALLTAESVFEQARIEPTKAALSNAAWNIVKGRMYAKLSTDARQGETPENDLKLLMNTVAWNEAVEGGLGAIPSKAGKVAQEYFARIGVPFVPGNFANAMGIAMNRMLSVSGAGMFPNLFKNARGTDPFFRTELDIAQRKAEAAFFLPINLILFSAIATGAIRFLRKWPDEEKERQEWQAKGWEPGMLLFPNGSGGTASVSTRFGPGVYVGPWAAAAGSIADNFKDWEQKNAKLKAEAEAKGLDFTPLPKPDATSIAAAAFGAMVQQVATGGRTASGSLASYTDYGKIDDQAMKRVAVGAVAPLLPGVPGVGDAMRLAGKSPDSKMASFASMVTGIPAGNQRFNTLGDPTGTQDAVNRILSKMAGVTWSDTDYQVKPSDSTAYRNYFNSDYSAPLVERNKAYNFDGTYRTMTPKELTAYIPRRGELFKEALAELDLTGMEPEEAKKTVSKAFQAANRQALEEAGVTVKERAQNAPQRAERAAAPSSDSGRSVLAGGQGGSGLGVLSEGVLSQRGSGGSGASSGAFSGPAYRGSAFRSRRSGIRGRRVGLRRNRTLSFKPRRGRLRLPQIGSRNKVRV